MRRVKSITKNNYTFFYKQHFYKQRQAEIGKKSSKQHPQVLLFGNYSHSSSTLSPKNNRAYSKKQAKKQMFWKHAANLLENEHPCQIVMLNLLCQIAKQLYWNHILAWVFSCKFAAYFQSSFPRNTSGWLLLKHSIIYQKSHEHNPQESASSKSSDVNLQLHSKKYFFMDIEQLFLRASSSCLLIYNNPLVP